MAPSKLRTMRAAHVGAVGAFSCLLAVSLAVAMQADGAAADDLLLGPASVFRSAPPSRSPQPWATSRVNQRHLLTFDSPRSSADTSLRAIATKDTPATDPAMAAAPSTCDKCQWQCAPGFYLAKPYAVDNAGLTLCTSGLFNAHNLGDNEGQVDCVSTGAVKHDYTFNSTCVACAAGKVRAAAGGMKATDCTACGKGTYSLSASRTCSACPAGKYNGVDTGVSECTTCPVGKYAGTTGLTVCTDCPAGKYEDTTGSILCTDCAVNTYNALTAKAAVADCLTCGANAASALASSAKTSCTCNNGYWGPAMGTATSLTCTACVAGKYLTGTSTSDTCLSCPTGKYQNSEGQIECLDCAVNTYNAETAKAAVADCLTCGANAASALASSAKTSCTCNNGYWGPAMGTATSLTCTACVAGKYRATTGATAIAQCLDCPAGKYQGSTGQADCTDCPTSTYSAATGATAITTCSPCLDSDSALSNVTTYAMGNYAPAGSTSKAACVNTRSSTCSNVPLGAELLLDQWLTCGACAKKCAADGQMLVGTCNAAGSSGATCEDCAGDCRMDLTFSTDLYMTKAEFTAAKAGLFLSAIKDSTKVPLTKSSIVSIEESSTTLVASKYITVKAKIVLSKVAAATGALTSKDPAFTASSLKTALITNGFTAIASDYTSASNVARFGTHFTDKGTVLAISKPTHTKVEGIIAVTNTTLEVVMKVSMPYTKASFDADAQGKFLSAVANSVGTPVDNLYIKSVEEKTSSRRVSRKLLAVSVEVDFAIRVQDAAAQTAMIANDGLKEDNLNAELAKQGLPASKVVTPPAAYDPAAPTATPEPVLAAAHRAVPARGLQVFVAIVAALLTSKFSGAC